MRPREERLRLLRSPLYLVHVPLTREDVGGPHLRRPHGSHAAIRPRPRCSHTTVTRGGHAAVTRDHDHVAVTRRSRDRHAAVARRQHGGGLRRLGAALRVLRRLRLARRRRRRRRSAVARPHGRTAAAAATTAAAPSSSVVLIGMRGAGKSHLARAAAAALSLECVDLDVEYET